MKLVSYPSEDHAIVLFWRGLDAALHSKKNPPHGRSAKEHIEAYFRLRSGNHLNLRLLMERFAEDFDGHALNRIYSKPQLEWLRLIFLRRSLFLFLAEKMMNHPIAGHPHAITSSTLGRILLAIQLPMEGRAPTDGWSAL